MWRYVGGGIAALLLTVAGMLFWSSQAGTKSLLGTPPAARDEPLGIADVGAPLEASERTREQRRFSRYDADENGAVSRDEYLQSRRKSYARLDLDGDGKLSFEEYAAKAVKKFASADRDKTGALTPAEFLATRVARKPGVKGNCPPPPLRANSGGGDDES
ncbi:MAG: histidine kinase [Sphingomonadaceae bacterium]